MKKALLTKLFFITVLTFLPPRDTYTGHASFTLDQDTLCALEDMKNITNNIKELTVNVEQLMTLAQTFTSSSDDSTSFDEILHTIKSIPEELLNTVFVKAKKLVSLCTVGAISIISFLCATQLTVLLVKRYSHDLGKMKENDNYQKNNIIYGVYGVPTLLFFSTSIACFLYINKKR